MGQYEMVLDFLQRYIGDYSKKLCGKSIAIWGAGNYGQMSYCAMVKLGIECKCFIDSDPQKSGSTLLGLPILAPEEILNDGNNTYFVIVAVASDDEIRQRLTEECYDYDSYLLMCSEIKAGQNAELAALPINRLRAEYNCHLENVPINAPILGDRYINDGMRIVPLDGLQEKALGDFIKWFSSGEKDALKYDAPCLCGSIDFIILSKKDRYGIPLKTVLCKECGLVMQNLQMNAAGFVHFYSYYFANIVFPIDAQSPEELFFWRKRDSASHIHDAIREYLTPASTILEIGCAAGSVVEYFNELGHESVGIDLDERYIAYGRSRGLNLFCCNSEDFLKRSESKFDIIILEHVLEHFVDVEKELSTIKQLLKPNGYIYISVPGIKGFSLDYHRFDFLDSLQLMHLYYWNKETFLQTMSWFGLHALKCDEYIDAVFQIGDIVPLCNKVNYSQDVLQFLLHLEKHRLSLQKGIYEPIRD